MEHHVTKIYVDSPVFGPEDEDVYRYIDTDIDDSEGLRLKSEDTLLQIHTGKTDTTGRGSANSPDSEKYVNIGKHYREDHSNQNKFMHQQSSKVQQIHPFNPPSANQVYEELNEEEEERLEMERRNNSQRKQMEQNHIPQLDLIDSDDEKPTRQGFTDLEIDEGRNSDAYGKTAEMVWMANRKSLLAKGGAKKPDLNLATKMENVPRPFKLKTPESLPSEYRSSQLQCPLSPVVNESSYNPQNEFHFPEAQSHFYPAITSQIPPHEVRGFQPFQPYTIGNLPSLTENNFSFEKPMESAWTTNHNEMMRYQQRRFRSEDSLIKIVPTAEGAKRSKDFIKANKQEVINKERPKKMYGEMFSKRKKKENMETGPLTRRHSEEIQIREPVLASTGQNMSFSVFQQPLPVSIHQQLIPAASSQTCPPHQLYPSYLVPMQSLTNPSVHPVEHQQRISIPFQIQGVSASEQQNLSVDINLSLINPDLPLPHDPSTSRQPVQQPQLTGRHLGYQLGTTTAVGGPMTDSQPMVSYGVLPHHAMNPYIVLPPVGDSIVNQYVGVEHLPPVVDQKQGRSTEAPPKGGYVDLLKKQNQPQQYKEYTLDDYRRLKKEIKTLNLGKLGPDLDTEERIEKLIKEKRKQQYSKLVKQRNRQGLALKSHRELAPDNHSQREEATDKRTIALEYAKTVPKPRIAHHESDNDLTVYEQNRKTERESLPDEIEELQLLKERHNLERKQLELIEMGIKTILSQNA